MLLRGMPFLADLDQPPRSRTRGFVIGFLIGIPIIAVMVIWVIPALVGSVLGGAKDFDVKLRQQDAYMRTLCTAGFVEGRDDALCSCALGTEYPSLDCAPRFLTWRLEVQGERCSDAATRETAPDFCACVDDVREQVSAAAAEPRDQSINAYERCEGLPDALALPVVEATSEATVLPIR